MTTESLLRLIQEFPRPSGFTRRQVHLEVPKCHAYVPFPLPELNYRSWYVWNLRVSGNRRRSTVYTRSTPKLFFCIELYHRQPSNNAALEGGSLLPAPFDSSKSPCIYSFFDELGTRQRIRDLQKNPEVREISKM